MTTNQQAIIDIIKEWASVHNTPIPKKELFKRLIAGDMSESTARAAIRALLSGDEPYIRRAVTLTNKSYYVLIRTK